MRLQNAKSGTSTATMPYTAPLPASPTLTNPDMILPYGEYDHSTSPSAPTYRAPSPDEEWRESNRANMMHFSVGSAHSNIGLMTPTTPIIYGNGTMLSDIGEVTEVESTPGKRLPKPAERRQLRQAQNAPLRSSPTLGYDSIPKKIKRTSHQRKVSMESTSTAAEDSQPPDMFKDFDDGVSVDDSVFQGDDEESVADSYSEDVSVMDASRLSIVGGSITQDDDDNSSAALSKRAEQILLNAKRRLNNMEGNLSRARSSLYITPSSSMSSIHSSSPLSHSTPSPPPSAGRIIPQLGIAPATHRQLHTPSDSPLGSPGHSRVFSENSIPLRSPPFPLRSSSAAGRYVGRTGMDGQMRNGPESPRKLKSSPPALKLEPLNEDDSVSAFDADRSMEEPLTPNWEGKGLTRSASSMQMRDLQHQMHDLKGRLSVLRDRARDDTMKRRSLQSLRTPSPFTAATAADQWYSGSKKSTEEGGDAAIPFKLEDGEVEPQGDVQGSAEVDEDAKSDITSVYEDFEIQQSPKGKAQPIPDSDDEDSYDTAAEEELEEQFENNYKDELADFESKDYESESEVSLYHDSLPTPLSHEDREDAFDYEHFFLHSAMGTISQQRLERRGSFSSEDSVETTRGPPIVSENTKSNNTRTSLGHLRSGSTDTVSTMDSFATATEGLDDYAEDQTQEDVQDNFAVQYVTLPPRDPMDQLSAKRSTFGSVIYAGSPEKRQSSNSSGSSRRNTVIRDNNEVLNNDTNKTSVHRPSVASFSSYQSTGTTRSFPLINKPKSTPSSNSASSTPDLINRSRDLEPSLLRESPNSSSLSNTTSNSDAFAGEGERQQPSPVDMLAREDQLLVERLVASLGKCVLGLQEAGTTGYEARVWRRRLDAARRVLEGEEGAV